MRWKKKQSMVWVRMCVCWQTSNSADYFMLTSRIWCPSRRPAFSASDPVLTELIKLPLSLPPTRVISELRLSPFSVTRWTVWQEFLMRPTDVTEGRKGLCSWEEVTVSYLRFSYHSRVKCIYDKWEALINFSCYQALGSKDSKRNLSHYCVSSREEHLDSFKYSDMTG